MKNLRIALSRLKPVYKPKEAGRRAQTNIRDTRGKCGVYMIYIAGELRYIGYSAVDLYSTILRHFNEWNDKRGPRVTYYRQKFDKETKIRYAFSSCKDAAALERALIIKHRPPDNVDKLEQYEELTRLEQNVYDEYRNRTAPARDNAFMEEAPF